MGRSSKIYFVKRTKTNQKQATFPFTTMHCIVLMFLFVDDSGCIVTTCEKLKCNE